MNLKAAKVGKEAKSLSAIIAESRLRQDEPLWSEETAHTIVAAVKAGSFLEVAAAVAGVDLKTLQRWLLRGSGGEPPFTSLVLELRVAIGEAENGLVGCIRKAARKNWSAAAWLLERQYPERWGKSPERVAIGSQSRISGSQDELVSALSRNSNAALEGLLADIAHWRAENGLPAGAEDESEPDRGILEH